MGDRTMLTNDELARRYLKYVQDARDAIENEVLPEDTEIISWQEWEDRYIDYCYEGHERY